MKPPARVFAAILLSIGAPKAGAADVEMVSGREYVGVLRREIGRAEKSITACLYLFLVNAGWTESAPMEVADALAAAKDRGVKVAVVLDAGKGEGGEDAETGRNRTAHDYLRAKGVDVFFSTAPAMMHAKAVVFDESTVLLGSTNWSEAAFSRNLEANLLVRDRAAARETLEAIRAAGRRELPVVEVGARLPAAFLTPRYAGAVSRNSDESAFDAYLWLLKESRGRPAFFVPLDVFSAALGIPVEGKTKKQYRSPLFRLLRRLKVYGLVTVAPMERGEDAQVGLVPLPGASVGIPAGYWEYGWDRRLPLVGKLSYIVNLLRAEASPQRPRWSASVRTVAREYGFSVSTVVKGTVALRRANLLEVEHDALDITGKGRRPNVYTPRGLYDPAERDRAWENLERAHGKEKLARARRCAALVYEDSDVDAVERFISLEESRGREKVEEAYRIIAEKAPSNPRRSAAYFFRIVERLEEDPVAPERGYSSHAR